MLVARQTDWILLTAIILDNLIPFSTTTDFMRAKLIVDDIDLLNGDIAITAKDHIDDYPDFDSNPSQRKLDISTDNVLDAASAAPMTVSTISKRHRDAICEKLFHCQEDHTKS